MTPKDLDTPAIGGPLDAPPPPPAAGLLQEVGGMRAVRTRGRFGGFAAVLGVGLVAPLLLLALRPLRRDLPALPPAWVVGAAAVWLGGFAAALAAALVPARGDVLPSAGRASRVGLAVIAALAAFALVGSIEEPGVSQPTPDGAWSLAVSCVRCMGLLLPIAAIYLIGGVVVLRRVLPMGARRIGIALGAAGGAMGGAVLLFHCPIAGTAHVVLGHVGGVALAALAGLLALPALLDRSSRY
jgi:Negative regulator of sigma F